MVKCCAAYNCKTRFEKGANLSFHQFPANPELRLKWIIATKRVDFNPSKYTYLCSKHFEKSCFNTERLGGLIALKKDALPTIFENEIDENSNSSEQGVEDSQENKRKDFSPQLDSHICKKEKLLDDNSDFENCNAMNEINLNLNLTLPKKSEERYDFQYKQFIDWCASKNIENYNENVILAYLSEVSQKYKASTLWSIYSMLKKSLLVRDNINIQPYFKLTAFLKKQSLGHVAKQSKVFSIQEINTFLTNAPDVIYLMNKVVLIVGIAGACRIDELTNLTIDDVIQNDDNLIINILNTRNNQRSTFTISNSEKLDIDVVSLCKSYMNMRPKNINTRRLFIKYYAGKCIAQNVGCHTIGALPCKIAAYLNLENPKDYTGHCFRRTSVSILADSGTSIMEVRRTSLLVNSDPITTSSQQPNLEEIEIKDEPIPLSEYEISNLKKEDPLNIEMKTETSDTHSNNVYEKYNKTQNENMLHPLETILLRSIKSEDLFDENEDPLKM